MKPYSFGDILLVPFPFTNQSASKQRPAIVISTQDYNQERADIIIMAITSQVKSAAATGEVIIANWENAGLLKPSVIKPVIATIEQTLVRNQLGHLDEVDRTSLQSVLQKILGDGS